MNKLYLRLSLSSQIEQMNDLHSYELLYPTFQECRLSPIMENLSLSILLLVLRYGASTLRVLQT